MNDKLIAAAQEGKLDEVKALIEAGADVNAAKNGKTALDIARENGHVAVVELLRSHQAQDELLALTGDTP